MAILAINGFIRDIADPNPLVRALSIRTMGYINVPQVVHALIEPLADCLKDKDPYVAKTACLAVAKLYSHDPELVLSRGLIDQVRGLSTS
jgi:vesicle coat complex subunit